MNPRALLGVVAGLAVAALGVREALTLTGDEQPRTAQDVPLEPSKVVALRDGGTGYAQRVRAVDFEAFPASGAGTFGPCSTTAPTGARGETLTFTRASAATRCQLVAESVYQGEAAVDEEAVLVERSRDAGARETAQEGASR